MKKKQKLDLSEIKFGPFYYQSLDDGEKYGIGNVADGTFREEIKGQEKGKIPAPKDIVRMR